MRLCSLLVVAALLGTLCPACCRAPCGATAPPARARPMARRAAAPTTSLPADPLAQRIAAVEWTDADLDTVARTLGSVTGLRVRVSSQLHVLRSHDLRVTLSARDVTLAALLDALVAPHGIAWDLRGRTLWLATPDEKASGLARLRYYDVRDLVGAGLPFATEAELLAALRPALDATTNGPPTAEGRNGILIVRGGPEAHDGIEAALRAERAAVPLVLLAPGRARDLGARRVTLRRDAGDLPGALAALAEASGLDFVLSPAAGAVAAGRRVGPLAFTDAPALAVLEHLLHGAALVARAEATGPIRIEPRAALAALIEDAPPAPPVLGPPPAPPRPDPGAR